MSGLGVEARRNPDRPPRGTPSPCPVQLLLGAVVSWASPPSGTEEWHRGLRAVGSGACMRGRVDGLRHRTEVRLSPHCSTAQVWQQGCASAGSLPGGRWIISYPLVPGGPPGACRSSTLTRVCHDMTRRPGDAGEF